MSCHWYDKQVHFKAGISGNPNVIKEAGDMQSALNAFESEVKSQCTALEAAVSEIDKLQEVTFSDKSVKNY